MLKPEAANWAVACWAEAVQQDMPAEIRRLPVTGDLFHPGQARMLRSRMAIEVQARPKSKPEERFSVWGSTPGSVPLPEEYDYIFKKTALNDGGLQKLAGELAQVGQIYGLDLSNGRYSDATLTGFLSQPHLAGLRCLYLNGTTTTTNAVLVAVARLFPELEEFNPGSKCYITDDGLVALRELLHLTRLNLGFCQKITNRGMAFVGALDNLEALNLDHLTALSDDGLAHLKTLPKLRALDLSGCNRISGAGMALLGEFPALCELRLDWNHHLTDAGLQGLRPLDGLLSLSLVKCTGLTDDGIAALADLHSLEELNLSWVERITDSGVAALAWLRSLRSLSLYQCTKLTDAGIRKLCGLSELRCLDLAGVEKITDRGLAFLKELDHLEELTLDGKHISGSGLVELVNSLPKLRRLHVWSGSQVSQAEAAQIRRPGMDVWIRGAR